MSLSEITDQGGNRLYFQGSEVFLQLKHEGRARKVGEVIGETLHTVRNLRRHEMLNRHEIGFNRALMKHGRFRTVVVHTDDGQELKTTRKWVLTHGRACFPGGKRYELQLFLKISDFVGFGEPEEEPHLEPTHSREPSQLPLFAKPEAYQPDYGLAGAPPAQ